MKLCSSDNHYTMVPLHHYTMVPLHSYGVKTTAGQILRSENSNKPKRAGLLKSWLGIVVGKLIMCGRLFEIGKLSKSLPSLLVPQECINQSL